MGVRGYVPPTGVRGAQLRRRTPGRTAGTGLAQPPIGLRPSPVGLPKTSSWAHVRVQLGSPKIQLGCPAVQLGSRGGQLGSPRSPVGYSWAPQESSWAPQEPSWARHKSPVGLAKSPVGLLARAPLASRSRWLRPTSSRTGSFGQARAQLRPQHRPCRRPRRPLVPRVDRRRQREWHSCVLASSRGSDGWELADALEVDSIGDLRCSPPRAGSASGPVADHHARARAPSPSRRRCLPPERPVSVRS